MALTCSGRNQALNVSRGAGSEEYHGCCCEGDDVEMLEPRDALASECAIKVSRRGVPSTTQVNLPIGQKLIYNHNNDNKMKRKLIFGILDFFLTVYPDFSNFLRLYNKAKFLVFSGGIWLPLILPMIRRIF